MSFSSIFVSPLLGFLREMVMEGLQEEVVDEDERMVGSLDPREVCSDFIFSTLPPLNSTVVDDFQQEPKTQTYIRAHRRAFDFNSTNNKVMWWLKSQSHAYIYDHYFLYVVSNPTMDHHTRQKTLTIKW